jgi:DNA repair protein SbcC/Rad50
MRPLALTIEGLRSFRAPVAISFENRDHLAIVGDTGAGKSSILEAMTYALYGRSTFTGQANQEIMNDLAGHMRVTLRFTVAGSVFEVTRALRRAGDRTVGSARASLTEFGPDGSEVRKIEGVRQVDSRVQEVLGLDAKAFLRTVVLPQGQFAQLLVGDDPAARAAVLRQVWRADELTRAGQLADDALPPLSELVGQVSQALDGTPDNPDAHLETLRADAGQRAGLAGVARETHSTAATARDNLAEANKRAAAAESVLGKIAHFDFPATTATAEQIVRYTTAITAERVMAESQQAEVRSSLKAVPPDDDGLGHQSIGSARTIILNLPSRAEAAQRAASRARGEAAEAGEAGRRAAELDEDLQALDSQLNQRGKMRIDLGSALTDAETKLSGAQSLLGEVQQATANGEAFQEQADGKISQAKLLKGKITQLQENDLIQAEQDSANAEKEYFAAQRHNAGAAASLGLHYGDECPVCSRPLPGEWQPLTAEDLNTARDAHLAAQNKLMEVRNRIRDLATRAEEIGSTQAAELKQRADESWEAAKTAAASLALLLGHDQVNPVRLPPDVELLQLLSSAADKARGRLEEHDSESQRLRDRRTVVDTNLGNARGALEKMSASSSRSSKETASALQALRSDVTSLPSELGIGVALPDDPLDIELISISGIDAANQLLDERAQELNRRAELRKQLQERLDALSEGVRELDDRWATEVLAPGNKIIAAVNRHRDTLSEGVTLLSLRDVTLPAAASLSDPARLIEIVATFRETTDTTGQRTRALAETTRTEADAARQTIACVAREVAIPPDDTQTLDADMVVQRAGSRATDADVEARTAAVAVEDFARLVAPLAALRRTRDELDLTHRVLKDLSAALKPGAFPKWLTLRRSRTLLIHASKLFEQMSGGRYAFAEIGDESAEWQIVDNDSNLARTPASLSGGEQFLASLALALGMVEMMARSGGRLESLWLDEGFGSLDRTNLDAAIEALTSISSRGRMVAVITHIRAVADQVDHVLAVTREATGSQANWLSPSQRAHLVGDDFGSEAADALSGLIELRGRRQNRLRSAPASGTPAAPALAAVARSPGRWPSGPQRLQDVLPPGAEPGEIRPTGFRLGAAGGPGLVVAFPADLLLDEVLQDGRVEGFQFPALGEASLIHVGPEPVVDGPDGVGGRGVLVDLAAAESDPSETPGSLAVGDSVSPLAHVLAHCCLDGARLPEAGRPFPSGEPACGDEQAQLHFCGAGHVQADGVVISDVEDGDPVPVPDITQDLPGGGLPLTEREVTVAGDARHRVAVADVPDRCDRGVLLGPDLHPVPLPGPRVGLPGRGGVRDEGREAILLRAWQEGAGSGQVVPVHLAGHAGVVQNDRESRGLGPPVGQQPAGDKAVIQLAAGDADPPGGVLAADFVGGVDDHTVRRAERLRLVADPGHPAPTPRPHCRECLASPWGTVRPEPTPAGFSGVPARPNPGLWARAPCDLCTYGYFKSLGTVFLAAAPEELFPCLQADDAGCSPVTGQPGPRRGV